jgi:hypothetical protein
MIGKRIFLSGVLAFLGSAVIGGLLASTGRHTAINHWPAPLYAVWALWILAALFVGLPWWIGSMVRGRRRTRRARAAD